MRRTTSTLLALTLASLTALPASAAPPFGWFRHGTWERVSVSDDGKQGNHHAYDPDLSDDGSRVVFFSRSDDLVPAGNNEHGGVFLRDLDRGQTSLVSARPDGAAPNQQSFQAAISGDGSTITFLSYATDLVEGIGGEPKWAQVFVRDVATGQTTLITESLNGGFSDGGALGPSLSDDGRYVAFFSHATDLVPSDTNGGPDVFVHDRQSGETRRVSVLPDGTQGNNSSTFAAISGDGSTVAFMTRATNLVPGDDNGVPDIVAVDLATGELDLVSAALDGSVGDDDSFSPLISLSDDGRYVAFQSRASDLVPVDRNGLIDPLQGYDVFVRDRAAERTERVSVTSAGLEFPDAQGGDLDDDGRYVTFSSILEGEDPADFTAKQAAYVHDRVTGATELLTVRSDGVIADADAGVPAISGDGSVLAMSTDATDLALGDSNLLYDILLRDRGGDLEVLDASRTLTGIAGVAVFTGVTVASAASDEVQASVTLRPEDRDLLIRISGGPSLPPQTGGVTVTGPVGITHALRFTLNGTDYEVRVSRSAPHLAESNVVDAGLFVCDLQDQCRRMRDLSGSWGVVGDEARVSLGLPTIALDPGERLTGLVASVGIGEPMTGILGAYQAVELQDITAPDIHVRIRPPGEQGHAVANVSLGRFGIDLPANVPYWMSACIGSVCGPESLHTAD